MQDQGPGIPLAAHEKVFELFMRLGGHAHEGVPGTGIGLCIARTLARLDGGDHAELPLIFISAKSEEIDRVLGLELGADDFIVKPFGGKEVVARIRAVTRRCLRAGGRTNAAPPFTMRDLQVFPAELRVRRGATTIDLSLREIGILRLLYENVGRVVDRDTFFDHLWGLDHVPNSRTLDQQIAKFRKRVEVNPNEPRLIRTVHGSGYWFDG